MRTWFDCMDFSTTLKIVELIEKCCSVNVMSKTETAIYLFLDYEIEPTITEMVWEELEKQNPEFFKAYKLRRVVKTQIEMFNWLVVQQIAAMHGNLHNISADALLGLASSAGMPPGMNDVADRPVRDLT